MPTTAQVARCQKTEAAGNPQVQPGPLRLVRGNPPRLRYSVPTEWLAWVQVPVEGRQGPPAEQVALEAGTEVEANSDQPGSVLRKGSS